MAKRSKFLTSDPSTPENLERARRAKLEHEGVARANSRAAEKRPECWGQNDSAIRLRTKRGETVRGGGSSPARVEYSPGLAHLLKRGRITSKMADAGMAYGGQYDLSKGCLKSQLDPSKNGSGGGGGHTGGCLPGVFALDGARAFLMNPRLIMICDYVCGMGYKVTELATDPATRYVSVAKVAELETTLILALEQLVTFFGLDREKALDSARKSPLSLPMLGQAAPERNPQNSDSGGLSRGVAAA